jgi:hypothetical protein
MGVVMNEIKLQSIDEIRQLLTASQDLWDENTIDEVFYESSVETTRFEKVVL